MLKYIKNINSESAYGLWKITENYQQLIGSFDKSKLEPIRNHHLQKQLEFLATRHLLNSLCEKFRVKYSGITKDEFGKPFLNNLQYHISVSHAYPYIVSLIHKSASCGIDIEKPKIQIQSIKHKFLNKKELEIADNDAKKLCLFWSSKEALYKLYGKKKLLFIENIKVEFGNGNSLKGKIILGDKVKSYSLVYEEIADYVVVYSI